MMRINLWSTPCSFPGFGFPNLLNIKWSLVPLPDDLMKHLEGRCPSAMVRLRGCHDTWFKHYYSCIIEENRPDTWFKSGKLMISVKNGRICSMMQAGVEVCLCLWVFVCISVSRMILLFCLLLCVSVYSWSVDAWHAYCPHVFIYCMTVCVYINPIDVVNAIPIWMLCMSHIGFVWG